MQNLLNISPVTETAGRPVGSGNNKDSEKTKGEKDKIIFVTIFAAFCISDTVSDGATET